MCIICVYAALHIRGGNYVDDPSLMPLYRFCCVSQFIAGFSTSSVSFETKMRIIKILLIFHTIFLFVPLVYWKRSISMKLTNCFDI